MKAARLVAFPEVGVLQILFLLMLISATASIGLSAQEISTIANFSGPNGNGPAAALIQGADGKFYGTTINGGTGSGSDQCLPPYGGCGTVYSVTPSGVLTSLHSFCNQSNCADGSFPRGALVLGRDGNYYGTTLFGGVCQMQEGCGTVFKITPSGTFTLLHSFCAQANCPDGFWLVGGLVQASDGNFYGTTQGGGTNNGGTVFKITPGGELTTLYSFCAQARCADGAQPEAALIQATDGNLYGTTWAGGRVGAGTVFRMTLAGALTTLYSFNGNHGSSPEAALIQASDGNFYGTTAGGGAFNDYCNHNACGTAFKITPSGELTTLHNFDGSDGGIVAAGLVQAAADGNFYGTTWNGGANGLGTVFKLTSSGTLTTVHDFTALEGGGQEGSLLQAPDGSLYGTTGQGGSGFFGIVFRLSFPLQFVAVTPCRLIDTRSNGGPIQGGTVRNFAIPQLGTCNIPSSAAYSLNVTVVPQESLSYLTVWPAGEAQPPVSTLNSPDGRTKANAAIASAGTSSAVSVYVTDTTDVILDIDGYFTAPGSETLQFYPLPPCRVIDTRGETGNLGGPFLAAQVNRNFPVAESHCVPSGPSIAAYAMNFTAVPHVAGQPLAYLTAWAQGQSRPNVSLLNNPTATAVANAAIVQAGTNGGITVYPSDDTDLLVDISGYFAAPGPGGLTYFTAGPCRAFDSRNNNGQPFTGELTVNIVRSPCPPPDSAATYVFNTTVVPASSLGYLTMWADSQPQPTVSTLNAYDGLITSNMAIVQNANGSTDAYAGDGRTQLILDISGYFAP